VTRHETDLLHVCFGGLGGHAGVIQPLTKELTRRGVRSTIVLYAHEGELEDQSSWSAVGDAISVAKRGRIDPLGLAKIARIVRAARPRVVVCHLQNPVIAAFLGQLLAGVAPRVVLVEHQPIDLRSREDQIKSLLDLPFIRGLVVLTDDYAARYPLASVPLRVVRGMVIIPNGVDLELFAPGALDAGSSGAGDGRSLTTVGMASRLTATKDVATLVRATALLAASLPAEKRVEVLVAGDGVERAGLEALAAELSVIPAVRFLGTLDEAGVAAFLQGLDVYVQSTLGETLSTSILQAYATGLPIVASSVEGVKNLIHDGDDGLLVPARSPQALADALGALVQDPRRRAELGERARHRAEEDFGVAVTADRYLALFARVDPKGPWSQWLRPTQDIEQG
jgi:glycosyltransferase involved in cell wall biosynthesis